MATCFSAPGYPVSPSRGVRVKNGNSLLAFVLVLIGATLSGISHAADEEGQIVCPPTTVSSIHSPSTSVSVPQGSNDETAEVLWLAIYNSDVVTVQRMMTYPNFAQLRSPQKGHSPLHMALSPCNASMVQLVLTHPDIDFNARDNKDQTPLHAAANCDWDVLDRILNHPRADPNVIYTNQGNSPTGRTQNRTPLHEAARRGNVAGVSALLEHGAHPNPKTSGEFTPLHLAAWWNRSETLLILLNYGANPNTHENEEGRTPLHSAIAGKSFEEPHALKILLADPASDSEAEDFEGRTPLHEAAFRNAEMAALLLLRHGADPDAEDDNGHAAWQFAEQTANYDVADLLRPRND